jgi:hypothetical protein
MCEGAAPVPDFPGDRKCLHVETIGEGLGGALLMNEEKRNESATCGEPEAPRCRMGSKTDKPCWREAVVVPFDGGDEPYLCPEHAKVVAENDNLSDWWENLRAIDQWIRESVIKTGNSDLERIAFNARDEARREYGRIAIRARAARMVADRGPLKPGEVPLFYEQEEEIARLYMREEAFNNARSVLEDLSEDTLFIRDKWATIDALASAADEAAQEAHRYQEELGLRPTE